MTSIRDTRLYVLASTSTSDGASERLMRAPNKSRAMKGAVTARVATASDVERLLAAGVVIESTSATHPPRTRRRRAP